MLILSNKVTRRCSMCGQVHSYTKEESFRDSYMGSGYPTLNCKSCNCEILYYPVYITAIITIFIMVLSVLTLLTFILIPSII